MASGASGQVNEVFNRWGSYKASVLLKRSLYLLIKRRKQLFGLLFLHCALALTTGWIVGHAEGNIYNTTSYFAIGNLLCILSNIQSVYFVFKTNQVFLKEHRRGLYSGFLQVMTSALSQLVPS